MDRFLRRQNLQLERYEEPMHGFVPANQRGLANEFGFRLFRHAKESNQLLIALRPEDIERCKVEAITYVSRFIEPEQAPEEWSTDLNSEAHTIGHRLAEFSDQLQPDGYVHPAPPFRGCGILMSCEGDLLCGTTLYEVKAGARNFRSVDLKQLLTYTALNYLSSEHEILSAGLVNPRQGVYFDLPLDELSLAVAGTSFAELALEITSYLSASETSP